MSDMSLSRDREHGHETVSRVEIPEDILPLVKDIKKSCREYWRCAGRSCSECEPVICAKYGVDECAEAFMCDLILRAYAIGYLRSDVKHLKEESEKLMERMGWNDDQREEHERSWLPRFTAKGRVSNAIDMLSACCCGAPGSRR